MHFQTMGKIKPKRLWLHKISVFIDDNTNSERNLELHPNGRKKAPMVVRVDVSCKSRVGKLNFHLCKNYIAQLPFLVHMISILDHSMINTIVINWHLIANVTNVLENEKKQRNQRRMVVHNTSINIQWREILVTTNVDHPYRTMSPMQRNTILQYSHFTRWHCISTPLFYLTTHVNLWFKPL